MYTFTSETNVKWKEKKREKEHFKKNKVLHLAAGANKL